VTAASLINRHGGVAGLLSDGSLSAAQRDYISRAMRVVQPVPDLAVELPAGRRDSYPADATALHGLVATFGLAGSADRLIEALRR
jgi:hypothetical protein